MSDKVLVTRLCRLAEDGTLRSAYGNFPFPWPRSGPVSCDDWNPKPECGFGFHGWLWGKGEGGVWVPYPSDVMLVVEVDQQDIVDLDGKVKFPKGNVIFCGSREEVTRYMAERGHVGIAYGHMAVGDSQTAEVGEYGIAIAGKGGKAIAGFLGMAQAGEGGRILIEWNDRFAGRYRIAVGHIGEKGLKPDTKYWVNAFGKFMPA